MLEQVEGEGLSRAGMGRAGGTLRRSIATLPPQAPSGLSRERALAILGQLVRVLRELRRRSPEASPVKK